ncbi:MAG: DUF177 domain-containing protein [Syntrophobacteraceae bacterium]|jgi:uncharacterized protein|nr:DUF177 domain-containing protein [Syntrophobacteraceae bacterium]
MRIRVDEIPEAGRTLRLHWDQADLAPCLPEDDPFDLKLIRPIQVELELQRHPDHVRILGKVQGRLELSCHRCLAPFEWRLDEPVDIFLIPQELAPGEEETELDVEDLDYDFFDGEIIEIDQLIAQQIFLALPYKVLCSEECRGLCPRCGVNLNEEPCRCGAGDAKSDFSELLSLRERLPDASGD